MSSSQESASSAGSAHRTQQPASLAKSSNPRGADTDPLGSESIDTQIRRFFQKFTKPKPVLP
jgi:hypothetical protein